jgi:uncharacterized protein GlcG (DUF336 family)
MSPDRIQLTLMLCTEIVRLTLQKGGEIGCAPLTVAVLDGGGHLMALQRQDGASNLRPQIAIGKAAGALGMGMSSRKIAAIAAERPQFVNALSSLSGGLLVPAAGGVRIKSSDGRLLGAVGVSGDTSDRDEECALHGLQAAGLEVFD